MPLKESMLVLSGPHMSLGGKCAKKPVNCIAQTVSRLICLWRQDLDCEAYAGFELPTPFCLRFWNTGMSKHIACEPKLKDGWQCAVVTVGTSTLCAAIQAMVNLTGKRWDVLWGLAHVKHRI